MGVTLLGVDCKWSLMGFGLSCKAVLLCPRGGEKEEVCFWLLKQWMKREGHVRFAVHGLLAEFPGWKPESAHSKASDHTLG